MERRVIELGEERLHVGEAPILTWESQGGSRSPFLTADCIKSTRYSVWKDGGWRAAVGPVRAVEDSDRRPGDLSRGKTLGEKLPTQEDAQLIAELHARKRVRQSLTIQRQQFQALLPHLRALVAASEQISDEEAA